MKEFVALLSEVAENYITIQKTAYHKTLFGSSEADIYSNIPNVIDLFISGFNCLAVISRDECHRQFEIVLDLAV